MAKSLRKEGKSYGDISKIVGVSKSTAKLWCQNVRLSVAQKKKLYTKQIEILSRGPKSSHERRRVEVQNIISLAEKEIKLPPDFEAYRGMGAMIYWGEGDKTKHFGIANSDPYLIKFMVRWLEDILGIKPERIKAHLNIHSQQNDAKMKHFWSDLTNIPIQNFGKSFVKPASKNFKKNTLYYGTVRLRIMRGTDFRYRVLGWVSAILKSQNLEVEKVQNKWHKLREDYNRP